MSKKNKRISSARKLSLGSKAPLQNTLVLGACVLGAAFAAQHASAQQIGDVFYIEMENHDLTQPSTYTSIQPILGNSAAPFQNSLMTPGDANAAQTAYATAYYNSGNAVHPSEPNYIWAEAGSNLGTASDADPSVANKNLYTPGTTTYNGTLGANGYNNGGTVVNTLTHQMDQAGVTWKNYQEDLQYTGTTASPINPQVSASGTGTAANNYKAGNGATVTPNAYNGSLQYNYAAKHNPMAFFTDSANKNVYQLSQLTTDLANNTVGQYNWITPNQYNDAHSSLSTSFTYNGTTYAAGTDQEAIAMGDNFLSIIIPQIEASQAYQNNGVIIINYDESEGNGLQDTTSTTIPEIVISKLAKGNAFASNVTMSHTSDLQTMEELFGLGTLSNQIQTSATAATGGYNADGTVNDLSSLFVSGAVPVPETSSSSLAGVAGLLVCGMAGLRRKLFGAK